MYATVLNKWLNVDNKLILPDVQQEQWILFDDRRKLCEKK